jgi:hypothetical protein
MEDGKLLRKTLSPHWWDLSPLEAKIIITLFWLADLDSGEVSVSLFSLSRRVNTLTKVLLPHLEKLKIRGLISFTVGENPLVDIPFKVLARNKLSKGQNESQIPEEIQYESMANNGEHNDDQKINRGVTDNGIVDNGAESGIGFKVNSGNNGNGFRSGRNNIKKTVPADTVTGTVSGISEANLPLKAISDLTASSLASELEDNENLALYKAYLKRYPKTVIYRAFKEVIQTPPDRIKKSPGAYFTFLVKKYGKRSS